MSDFELIEGIERTPRTINIRMQIKSPLQRIVFLPQHLVKAPDMKQVIIVRRPENWTRRFKVKLSPAAASEKMTLE